MARRGQAISRLLIPIAGGDADNIDRESNLQPLLIRTKTCIGKCTDFIANFESGRVMRFFKARSYERDFRDLNSLLNEALGDLQMALTGEIHRAVVDVQVVSDDVLERFRNEFLSHVESRFDHVDQRQVLAEMQCLLKEQQEQMMAELEKLKQRKEQEPAAYKRSATKRIKARQHSRSRAPN